MHLVGGISPDSNFRRPSPRSASRRHVVQREPSRDKPAPSSPSHRGSRCSISVKMRCLGGPERLLTNATSWRTCSSVSFGWAAISVSATPSRIVPKISSSLYPWMKDVFFKARGWIRIAFSGGSVTFHTFVRCVEAGARVNQGLVGRRRGD